MSESKHTITDLYQMQSLPLDAKIRMTERRIIEWVERYGLDNVYISFSGGKDSTVLLHIARQLYPGIKAVFVDTGLEYPEIRLFVKLFDNIDWLRPKMTFKQVIEKYGYPFISKEVSECVYGARKYLGNFGGAHKYSQFYRKLQGIGEYQKNTIPVRVQQAMRTRQVCETSPGGGTTTSIENSEDWESIKKSMPWRAAALLGILTKDNKIQENIPDKNRSRFSCERYKFFLECPESLSSECCKIMKKGPMHKYAKETGRNPITAQMASESRLRTQQWLKNGCNGFDMKSPISNPMSFWTEQDVLMYFYLYITPHVAKMWELASNGHGINRRKARKFLRRWGYTKTGLCSVYGEVVIDYQATGQVDGQMNLSEYGIFDKERPLLKTTGCDRTGCMFCGYGCHLEKSPGRFERMKQTHPKQYDFIMKPRKEGGLGYKELIDWINEHGDLNIRY